MVAAPVLASIATASDANSAATSITVAKPTGTASSDVLFAVVTLRLTNSVVTPPAGWTLISQGSASTITLSTFWKPAGGSEPANYTFTTAAGRQAAGIARITGADPVAPIDVRTTATGVAGTSLVGTSVDPNSSDTLLLECFGHNVGTGTITNPPGATSDWSFSATTVTAAPINALAHETLSVDTPTGTRTATASVAGNWVAQMLVIQPPGVAGTGFTGWGIPL